jgi:hypothetical protein
VKTLALAPVLALAFEGCAALQPAPQVATRTDTVRVTVTDTVMQAARLPSGDSATVCLSTGMPVTVLVTASGDTLIGDARVSVKSVRPILDFAGRYAEQWPDTVRFEKRVYRRRGVVAKRMCDELKHVGEHEGVPIFAEVTAPQPLPAIVVPVRPGTFQTYALPTQPARRR